MVEKKFDLLKEKKLFQDIVIKPGLASHIVTPGVSRSKVKTSQIEVFFDHFTQGVSE